MPLIFCLSQGLLGQVQVEHVVSSGPHERMVETIRTGQVAGTFLTNRYVVFGSGLNHWSPELKQWIPAQVMLQRTPTSVVATGMQYNVSFNLNLAGQNESYRLTMPDGQVLKARLWAIVYYDRVKEKSVILAEAQNTDPEIVNGSEVIYPLAFPEIGASVQFQVAAWGMEQNILFSKQLPQPTDLGLTPEKTSIEIWSELLESPPAQEFSGTIWRRDWRESDKSIHFNSMLIPMGQAFAANLEAASFPAIPVAKAFETVGGQKWLIESFPFEEARPILEKLPKSSARFEPVENRPEGLEKFSRSGRSFPERLFAARFEAEPVQGAQLGKAPALVADYSAVVTETNKTFFADLTYLCESAAYLTAKTRFEGGCCIKFRNTSPATISINGTAEFLTGSGRPVIFTARDDHSVGEQVGTNSLSGDYGFPQLDFRPSSYGAAVVTNVQFRYAQKAISLYGVDQTTGKGLTLEHAQLVNCDQGINHFASLVEVRNALFDNVSTNFCGPNSTIAGEHLTVHTANPLIDGSGNSFAFTNSIFYNVTFGQQYTAPAHVVMPSSNPFQSAGSGDHYLAGNTYRDYANSSLSINAGLLAALARKTTYPPTILTAHFTRERILARQTANLDAASDGRLDLGFHYDNADYAVNSREVTAELLLTNGVTVLVYGPKGFVLKSGGRLVSEGTPTALNRLLKYQCVQEQPRAWGTTTNSMSMIEAGAASVPQLTLRFTEAVFPSDPPDHRFLFICNGSASVNSISLADNQLYAARFQAYTTTSGMAISALNNLWHRSLLELYQDVSPMATFTFNACNNLFHHTTNSLIYYSTASTWTYKANLFDHATNDLAGSSVTASYNAYRSTTSLGGSGNVTLNSDPDYQTGTLGAYYYPSSGGVLGDLINADSSRTWGEAGLAHHTVKVNNDKESAHASSNVDIGFHYVACTNNAPFDTDGDGSLSDYFEDRDGDNSLDNGETNVSSSDTDSNGLSDVQEEQLKWNFLVNDLATDENLPEDRSGQNTQSETAVAMVNGRIVVAWMDTNKGKESQGKTNCWYQTPFPPGSGGCEPQVFDNICQFMGWGVSSDGGQTFVDKTEPPILQYTNTSSAAATFGDLGDPVLAAYQNTLYLIGNPQRPCLYEPQGAGHRKFHFPLWKSTDYGATFSLINIAANSTPMSGQSNLVRSSSQSPPPADVLDKPWIAVNPETGQLYVAMGWQHDGIDGDLGRTVLFFRSNATNDSLWEHKDLRVSQTNFNAMFTPFVLYFKQSASVSNLWVGYTDGSNIQLIKSTDNGTTFPTTVTVATYQGAEEGGFTFKPFRNSSDAFSTNTFRAPSIFQIAANPSSGHLYMAYHNKSASNATHTDVYLKYSTDSGATWLPSGVGTRVNDVEGSDQWQPTIAVKPDGTKLFIGWYDRGHAQSPTNHQIKYRGQISAITTNGPLTSAKYFNISTADFPPVFTGTKTNAGSFDPVYGAALNNGGVGGCLIVTRCGHFWEHMMDYDQVTCDNASIYFSWMDCRTSLSRAQADIRFGKIDW